MITIRFSVFLIALLLLGVCFKPVYADTTTTNTKHHVLVIHSWSPSYVWRSKLHQAMTEHLEKFPRHEQPVVHEEGLDLDLFSDRLDNDDTAAYLSQKYAETKIDTVIAEGTLAANFLLKRPFLFSSARQYFFNFASSNTLTQQVGNKVSFSVTNNSSRFKQAVDTIKLLLPQVKRVVAVLDQSPLGQNYKAILQEIGKSSAQNIPLDIMDNFTDQELYAWAASLPTDTAIFYLPVYIDRQGTPLDSVDIRRKLTKASSVPVFCHYDVQLDEGVVGGFMISAARIGTLIGDIAARGDTATPISDADYATTTMGYFFDYQALKRWQIPENRLPPGSVVINRPMEIWKEYLTTIITAMSFMLALVFFVAVLLLENRRRRIAERNALEQEAHFRVLIEQAPDAILVYDYDLDRFIDANINAERLFACSREELLGSEPLRFHPEIKLKGYEYNEVINRVLNNETISLEEKVKNSEGQELVCELRLARLPSKDRKLIRASYDDITERKRAEDALIQSEQKVRAIFDHSYGFIGLLAPDGTILECNRTALEFYGIPIEDVRGTPFCDTPWWSHSPEDQERLRSAVLTAAKGKLVRYEATHAASDGTIHFIDFSLKPVLDESGEVVLLIPEGRDITDYKKLKDQLYQSQKMDSLGRLAGGVAHDFNNMLSIIMGSAELLLRKVTEGDQLHKYIEQILNAAKRSSEITQQLLAFSRKEIIFPRPVNLNSLIIESKKILDRLISEDIRLAFYPSNDLWTIKIDPSQLDQILMNLLVNARDAMPNGGSLSIGTANLHIDGDYSSKHYNVKPGDYVQLTVSDTGSGMDQETQKRIFEPFFTTKEVGKGTGLGLATVFGIVTQNNGFIKVYSELGQGTVFKIYFPCLAGEAIAVENPVPTPMTGSGTILLVEDEKMLLDTTTYMLGEIGYTVIQAQSPEAAIAICEKKNQKIDLILTDVVMPGLNGREMMDRIEAILPNTKVLYMSGYTADIIAQRGIVDEGMYFITKPIDMNKLNEKILEILTPK